MHVGSKGNSIMNLCDNCNIVLILCAFLANSVVRFSAQVYSTSTGDIV